ncbi:hypothetical protein [Streptomyces sp. NPDC058092]|uniref:hypothetical protein n=1 Tax=Streptomyces sp. NPDC058092 TaxID=3346336 RepID=UPI0036EDCEBB
MRTYTTRDGGSVQTRSLDEFRTDMHYRDADGRTVATVVMAKGDAARLVAEISR